MKIESINLSHELRAQLKMRKGTDRPAMQLRPAPIASESEKEAKYYEKEFRKFHIKLALIISTIVAATLTLIFNLPGLIDRFYPSIRN
jgi:hypothetical protein